MSLSREVENEVLRLLRELNRGKAHKEILEAILQLDAKVSRVHADMMELASEIARLQAKLAKPSPADPSQPHDVREPRKDRRRSDRLH